MFVKTCLFDVYHRILIFNNPKKAFENIVGKKKMQVTSIFFFSHNAFEPLQSSLFVQHFFCVQQSFGLC